MEEHAAHHAVHHENTTSSESWKSKRLVARLFGIGVGCVTPVIVSLLLLSDPTIFRGGVGSAKVLIERGGAADHSVALLDEKMDAICWVTPDGTLQQPCTLAESFAGHPFPPGAATDTCTCAIKDDARVLRKGPLTMAGDVKDVIANNVVGVAISTVMFTVLFMLWCYIIKTDRLDKALEAKIVALSKSVSGGLVLAGSTLDGGLSKTVSTNDRMKARREAKQHRKCADVALDLLVLVVSGGAAVLTVWLIIDNGQVEPQMDGRSHDEFSSRFIAFCVGFLMGGGLLGAPFGQKLANQGFLTHVPGGQMAEVVFFMALVGTIVGWVCVVTQVSLSQSPVALLAADPLSREAAELEDFARNKHHEQSYLAVQYAKLYRERSGSKQFSTEMIQQMAAGLCALVWDVVVVACKSQAIAAAHQLQLLRFLAPLTACLRLQITSLSTPTPNFVCGSSAGYPSTPIFFPVPPRSSARCAHS